jgi:hypothetical protein
MRGSYFAERAKKLTGERATSLRPLNDAPQDFSIKQTLKF